MRKPRAKRQDRRLNSHRLALRLQHLRLPELQFGQVLAVGNSTGRAGHGLLGYPIACQRSTPTCSILLVGPECVALVTRAMRKRSGKRPHDPGKVEDAWQTAPGCPNPKCSSAPDAKTSCCAIPHRRLCSPCYERYKRALGRVKNDPGKARSAARQSGGIKSAGTHLQHSGGLDACEDCDTAAPH